METRDPDDMFALCFLASHPNITLRAVTINPGSRAQIGVIRHLLHRLDRSEVPIGARNPDSIKDAVSEFHYEFLGNLAFEEADDVAHNLIAATINLYPDLVLLTGAPLHNLRLFLNHYPLVKIKRWVGQGGFAHEIMKPLRHNSPGLLLIYNGMDLYLNQQPDGKMFHDPLAACIAINRNIARLQEVEVYRQKGEWGARIANNTNTFITITVDKGLFFKVLTQS